MKRLCVVLALASLACATPAALPPVSDPSQVSTDVATAGLIEELRNATYAIDERIGPIALRNGRWSAEGTAPGLTLRPVIQLVDGFLLVGDLDENGREELVVALSLNTGGSGVFTFLAVVARTTGRLRNVATTSLGDRVQVRAAQIDGRRLLVNLVRAGTADAACCPGELVELAWTLGEGRLNAISTVVTGRLSAASLAGPVWELRAWDITEPAAPAPAVTLTYDAGRFTGMSGCNRYTASVVAAGDVPGRVSVGPVAGTRMACPEPQSAVESRYLEQLGGARSVGFLMGQLAVGYTRPDGTTGTMLFVATPRR